jgi:CRP-like cAMP-binding protein
VVGEAAIFGDVPRTATATAKTRLEALRVCKDLFLNVVRGDADAAMQLNRILAMRLANTTAQLSAAAS